MNEPATLPRSSPELGRRPAGPRPSRAIGGEWGLPPLPAVARRADPDPGGP